MEKSMKRYMPIFVLPTFFAFILGFIIPFVLGVGLSFCKFTTVTDAKFIGFSNYVEALKDTVFRHSFWYTTLFAATSLIEMCIRDRHSLRPLFQVSQLHSTWISCFPYRKPLLKPMKSAQIYRRTESVFLPLSHCNSLPWQSWSTDSLPDRCRWAAAGRGWDVYKRQVSLSWVPV